MKKLMSVVSIFVLSLFMGSAYAAEPPMEEPTLNPSQVLEPMEATEESGSALDRFAVWPFESIEKKSQEETAGAIDNVKMDQSVDDDGKTHDVIGIDDPSVESD